MKTFLSILSVKTNNFSNEKITIGLVAIAKNYIHYSYSKNKLKHVNKIMNTSYSDVFIINMLNQINNSIKSKNKGFIEDQLHIELKKSLFTEEYFKYLTSYSNGLIHFSDTFKVESDFDKNKFATYFENFVGEKLESSITKPIKSFATKLNPYFKKEGLKAKADLKYNLKPNQFKGILKSVQIPLLTVNGSIKPLQIVDFQLQPVTIANHLYETKVIYDALKSFAKTSNNNLDKVKVAFEEPKLNSKQHKVFDLAFKEYDDYFEFISPDQVDSFTDTIAHSNNTKFSALVH